MFFLWILPKCELLEPRLLSALFDGLTKLAAAADVAKASPAWNKSKKSVLFLGLYSVLRPKFIAAEALEIPSCDGIIRGRDEEPPLVAGLLSLVGASSSSRLATP